jgi:hypothetical protein
MSAFSTRFRVGALYFHRDTFSVAVAGQVDLRDRSGCQRFHFKFRK